MKDVFYFKLFVPFNIYFLFVACSDIDDTTSKSVPPSIDFPYIVNDMDADWVYFLSRLSHQEDYKIDELLVKYNLLVGSYDKRIRHFLQKMIIQHCVYHVLLSDFNSEQEISLLKDAVLFGLQAGEIRVKNLNKCSEKQLIVTTAGEEKLIDTTADKSSVKNKGEQLIDKKVGEEKLIDTAADKSSVKNKGEQLIETTADQTNLKENWHKYSEEQLLAKIETIVAQITQKAAVDKQTDNQLSEKVRYIIHATVMEYIALSFSDKLVTDFLGELFALLDNGKQLPQYHDANYFHRSFIADPPLHFEVDACIEESDEVNIMKKHFHGINLQLDSYLQKTPRNKQQMNFQNKLIRNHCYQKQIYLTFDHISKDLLGKAQTLKLEYFTNNLRKFSNKIFNYTEFYTTYDTNTHRIKYVSMVNLNKDSTFSKIHSTNFYKELSIEMLGNIENILIYWIEEMIEMSLIADVDMYMALKHVFDYIDDKFDINNINNVIRI